jgi:MscS family membrane protein
MAYALHLAEGTESRMDEQLIPIIRRSLKVIFVSLGILHILSLLDVNIAALIAGVSIGGLALALAAQDTVKNLIGSAMIFFDRPFQIGDYITGAGLEGTVTEVGFRTTRIQILDTSIISVPNGTIANEAITNKGVRVFRIYNTNLGITYDTPPDLIEKFIQALEQIILNHPKTRKEGYYVKLSNFDASSISILFRAYLAVGTYDEELQSKQDLMFAILRLADQIGVSFAFPSSTIYMAPTDAPVKMPEDVDQRIESFLADYKKRHTPEEEFLD